MSMMMCGDGNEKVSRSNNLLFISYNIDGLNEKSIQIRTNYILQEIVKYEPDVIQFQEVVLENIMQLCDCLKKYGYYSKIDDDVMENIHYFTISFLKKSSFDQIDFIRKDFENSSSTSSQGRDLFLTYATKNKENFLFVNTHLESCGKAMKSRESFTRQSQLKECLRLISSHNGPAILAGDMNIRDAEASNVMKSFVNRKGNDNLIDAAMFLKKEKEKTWFLPGINSNYASRYDRVIYNNKSNLRAVYYSTLGHQKIFSEGDVELGQNTYLTASDHRGMFVEFEFGHDPYLSDSIIMEEKNFEKISSRNIDEQTRKRKLEIPGSNEAVGDFKHKNSYFDHQAIDLT